MFMRTFFRGIARVFAFLRVSLANLFVLFVLLALAVGFIALATGPDRVTVADGGALLVAPKGAIVEQAGGLDPLAVLGGELGQTPLGELLRAIDRATRDERIGALVFDPSSFGYAAPAQLEVLGDALAAFRAEGKKIVAKAPFYGRDDYYLASFADEILMHPMGEVALGGYGMYGFYYRRLLDKLDVNVHVFRVGAFKSFVEPFTRDDMSPAAKRDNAALVERLWGAYVRRVAANRDLAPEAVRDFADRYDDWVVAAGGDAAKAALDHGLVDALLSEDDVSTRLQALAGEVEDDYRHVTVNDYARPAPAPLFGDVVGVVVASGYIMMGEAPRGAIGDETMAELLEKARRDRAVRAVVLRVDTGGGSALASERIRQAVSRVQDAGKPVVVSMGGTAASGGYWISATADEIWAAPTTITGSIGIGAIVPTFEGTMERVGLSRDGVGSGPFASAIDPARGLDERMARALQASVEHGYRQFIDLVAKGRGMASEEVEALAQGRIWTGEQALELGLVDGLGHLEDAVASAAALAGVERYGVRAISEPRSAPDLLLERALEEFAARPEGALGEVAGRLARDARLLRQLGDPRRLYALCEACPLPL